MQKPQPTAARASLVLLVACLLPLAGCTYPRTHPHTDVQTIAFASCARSDQPRQIWDSILKADPDLFLFIGDNVYVDIPRPPKGGADFERTYSEFQTNQPGWRELREQVPVLATWDDHDYGLNDAGKEFPLKDVAQQQFIKFFDLPQASPVRDRPGVYEAHIFGRKGQRVQVILLDTRTFRDPIKRNPNGRVNGLGPYVASENAGASMLGQAQWDWLEEQLKKPTEVRVIASSIQVLADEHGWETWGNMIQERERLFKLIGDTGANGVVFISGDRHHTEISRIQGAATPYPIWDFTNSGMNEKTKKISEPNRHRVGEALRVSNFGLIQIDWGRVEPVLTYTSRDAAGEVLLKQRIGLSELTLGKP